MRYTGEICPVCGKPFTEEDDIVVCPECGTPHHRACYFENKTCAHAAQHKEGFEWHPQNTSTPVPEVKSEAPKTESTGGHRIVFCPKCGAENPAEEPTCKQCGERLYNNPNGLNAPQVRLPDRTKQVFSAGKVVIQPEEMLGENTAGDTAEFVQGGSARYIPKFFVMEKMKKKVSFNWAAFFFTPHWFFYRKMYAAGAVLIAVLLAAFGCSLTPRAVEHTKQVMTVLEETVDQVEVNEETAQKYVEAATNLFMLPEMQIRMGLLFAVHLFSGLYGNYYYKRYAEKQVAKLRKESKTQEEYRLRLFKNGGVSLSMALASILIMQAAPQLISFIFLR